MGLTGGVKSHRLSGQISPYCEKKRHWLCAIARLCFILLVSTTMLKNSHAVCLFYDIRYLDCHITPQFYSYIIVWQEVLTSYIKIF